ncbi:MAG: ATP-binding cassette domain-containing protein [Pontiellaceae bacterium]|jgi:ABC-type Fe3+/spermidine/putrescine transport system ATPase subunit|nr:ATP-binding cassette domain-containing protein [Pontiellaceae bacterium]
MNPFYLETRKLSLTLNAFSLKDICLGIEQGEYHMLLGPSGSGKSTLMKALLGFHTAGSGAVLLDGRDISGEAPEKRRMGYVPQNYALFPHMSVMENIRYGARRSGLAVHEADRHIDRLIAILGIAHLGGRDVLTLSGGEKQRVAICRALAVKPCVVLLDEPYAAIDEGSRRVLWCELKHIMMTLGVTTLHITHSLEEAEILGDRLTVLMDGRVVQNGTGKELFEHPANEPVARYLNYRNIYSGKVCGADRKTIAVNDRFSVRLEQAVAPANDAVFCIRPQDAKIIREDIPLRDELKENVYSGVIAEMFQLTEYSIVRFQIDGSGSRYDIELKYPGHIDRRLALFPGKKISVALWQPKIIVFPGAA